MLDTDYNKKKIHKCNKLETNRKTKSVSTENEEQIINNLKHYQKPVLVSDAPKESAVLGVFFF